MSSIKPKSANPYWTEFSVYQSFDSVDAMLEQIKIFQSKYDLSPAVKAVLNTIKLHAKKTFIGVCWMYREEIAKKAKVSLASVKRAIKLLKDSGILKVYPHIHTKRGGQTHNVYVINPIFETAQEPTPEPPSEAVPETSRPVTARTSDDKRQVHKNPDKNSHKTLNNLSIGKTDILKNVPSEFIDLMEPFYANNPEVIHARWKTVCSAVKKSCLSLSNTSWDTIGQAWKDVVKFYKRGKIKNSTDDGLGAYFYGVLCDYLTDDFLRNAIFSTSFMK